MMKMKGIIPISDLLVFLLCVIHGLVSLHALPNTMRLELIHRQAHPLIGNMPKTQLQRIKELLHRDINRYRMISHKRRRAWETSSSNGTIEMAMHSGADYGTGEYLVELKVGTPAQKFTLIADTGSDLTWMNCRYGTANRGRINHRRVFHAGRSASFKIVPCLSDMCKIDLMNLFSLALCPTPLTPCAYDFRYLDGSSALGIFANETITVGLTNGRKSRLHDTLIGCSSSFRGDSFKGADGVLGLGYSKFSFAKRAAEIFGGKFSYCLVDHLSPKNVSTYLTFGATKNETSLLSNMRYTQLGLIGSFYAVNTVGISIGGTMLTIPSQVWDANRGGGTIIDSGTSLMFLAVPAYEPVMAALKMAVSKFVRLKLGIGPMEYCFNSTGYQESLVPRLKIHFADGARFEPPVKSYVIAAADRVKCLGFVSVSWPGSSVIGNILQQNHLWEFDLLGNTLGFAPSTCI